MEARRAMLLHSIGALVEGAVVNFRFHLAGFSFLVTATPKRYFRTLPRACCPHVYRNQEYRFWARAGV